MATPVKIMASVLKEISGEVAQELRLQVEYKPELGIKYKPICLIFNFLRWSDPEVRLTFPQLA
jgi:hypothetical protein